MLSRVPRATAGLASRAIAAATTSGVNNIPMRAYSNGAPEKIECFIDGKKVLVDPGTTVLQVRTSV